MKKVIFIVIVLFLWFKNASTQVEHIEFIREKITIELSENLLMISGFYHYKNPEKKSKLIKLYYPFPQDKSYGKIIHAFAFDVNDTNRINLLLTTHEKYAIIKLSIKALEHKILCIGYTQEVLGNKAEYITTTTKAWHKPLKSAYFELIVPSNVAVDSISYKPDDTLEFQNKTYYYFNKDKFWPDENFVFFFKRKNQ